MGEIEVRPAGAADVPAIAELFAGLSPRSVRLRFSHESSREVVRHHAEMGPATTSLVAVDQGRVVGEARYESGSTPPELAVTVADDHQGHGLGRRLVEELRLTASAAGIPALRAVVRTDNRGMLRLLRTSSTAIAAPVEDGEVVLDLATDDQMPPWPVRPGARKVLVESRSIADTPAITALWEAGYEVRKCLGPSEGHRSCPVLELGGCRLADDADVVVALLPGDDAGCQAVTDAHRRDRPERLAASSQDEWRDAARQLTDEG